jgi:integrase
MNDLIDAHLDWMAREGYSSTSIEDRRQVLTCLNRRLRHGLDDTDSDEITAYLTNPNWSRWTAHTYRAHLSGFYSWGVAEGELIGDPMTAVPKMPNGSRRPKPITPLELAQALQRSGEPYRTGIMLAVGAGLRSSEMAACRREDVTEEFVHVRRGKGGKERWVETCAALWEHVREKPSGLLLRRPYGRPVTGAWLSSHQRRHWVSIGLPQIHWHRLRHTFCTAMLQAGHDALVLRDLMGHASVATTQIYALPAAEQRRNAVAAVDALIRNSAPAGV